MYARFLFLTAVVWLLAGCGDAPQPKLDATEQLTGANRPTIIATNFPLYYLTSQIARSTGDAFDVVLPELPADPADWQPGPADITRLQNADLVVANGAGYESWLDWVSLPADRVLISTEGFAGELLEREETVQHQHGPQGEHSHAVTAVSTWLDPNLAARQAEAIATALKGLSPRHSDVFNTNLADVRRRLRQLDQQLDTVFAGVDAPLLFSHPVYQYLQTRYGLNGISLHWEPEQPPDTAQWIELQAIVSAHPASVLIWEDTPTRATSERLTDLGIRSIVFRTAAGASASADYFEIMAENVSRVAAGLASQ